eukprot:jgi/Chlat1/6121/Chrsp409S05658
MLLTDEVAACMGRGRVFKDNTGRITSLDFHRTEDFLVTTSEDESIHLYNTASGKLVKTVFSKKYGADNIRFTHHSSSVICSSKNEWDESLRYLSLHDNRYLRYFRGHHGRVVSLCMSPKNDSFMSASLDKTVRLWDLRTNVCQGLLRVRGRPAAAYDQQGLVFAVAMEASAVKLYDVRSFDKGPFDTFNLSEVKEEVASIEFSNDGKLMLLTTLDNQHVLLDAYSGDMLQCFTSPPSEDGTVMPASFSPDAQYIVAGCGDRNVRVWNSSTGTEVGCWKGHVGVPSVVRWAPRRMLVASACSALVLWIPDLAKLSELQQQQQQQQPMQT